MPEHEAESGVVWYETPGDAVYPEPEWIDCTCGHPNDGHSPLGECPFLGCGCGWLHDESDDTTSPGATS